MDRTKSLRVDEADDKDQTTRMTYPLLMNPSSPLEQMTERQKDPMSMNRSVQKGFPQGFLFKTSLPNAASDSSLNQKAIHVGQLIENCSVPSALQFVAAQNTDSALDVCASNESGIALVQTSDEQDIVALAGGKPASMKSSNRKSSPGERLQRSRERNRMHARKTRQRKKEHMQNLQNRADELKQEQLILRQAISEKTTANILVGLFSVGGQKNMNGAEDPEIERLLRRPVEEIPDASKISELPALVLPGQHNCTKKTKLTKSTSSDNDANQSQHEFPDDGIDYQLLGKDRASCTPAELDQIRRERNRMHAKRTRDRKRIFMEEMEEIIRKMEEENILLQDHLESLGGAPTSSVPNRPPQLVSPIINPTDASNQECAADSNLLAVRPEPKKNSVCESPEERQQLVTQLKSLLVAAGAFEQPENAKLVASSSATAVSATDDSSSDNDALPVPARKRRRLEVPKSITTTASMVGA